MSTQSLEKFQAVIEKLQTEVLTQLAKSETALYARVEEDEETPLPGGPWHP